MHRLCLLLVLAGFVAAGCAKNDVNTSGKPTVKPAPSASPTPQGQPPQATPTPAVKTDGKTIELIAVKNARVYLYPAGVDKNGGGAHRFRVSGLGTGSADVAIFDFDRAALKAFLDKNAGKEVSGKLVLAVRALDKDKPGKIEAATLDSASDWNQGTKSEEQADKGEVCDSAAQFDVKPWTTADGKPAKSLRDLVFTKDGGVKSLANSKGVDVATGDVGKTVVMELGAKFIEHVGRDAACKGIVLFTRNDEFKPSFSSRDKAGMEPRLVISVK